MLLLWESSANSWLGGTVRLLKLLRLYLRGVSSSMGWGHLKAVLPLSLLLGLFLLSPSSGNSLHHFGKCSIRKTDNNDQTCLSFVRHVISSWRNGGTRMRSWHSEVYSPTSCYLGLFPLFLFSWSITLAVSKYLTLRKIVNEIILCPWHRS